ncbi:hypothetical protein CEXT_773501 [Caerostris extrusa]|uniref:Uncharacterized protein n=1 Tax=Caerostris extrusa TaxID=172846 RepID=A0AAV4PB91_CAEEX|nr:hypothetical protein CEXT_773501 [Caerostris extrusa]
MVKFWYSQLMITYNYFLTPRQALSRHTNPSILKAVIRETGPETFPDYNTLNPSGNVRSNSFQSSSSARYQQNFSFPFPPMNCSSTPICKCKCVNGTVGLAVCD